jgi:hypothetical protein
MNRQLEDEFAFCPIFMIGPKIPFLSSKLPILLLLANEVRLFPQVRLTFAGYEGATSSKTAPPRFAYGRLWLAA